MFRSAKLLKMDLFPFFLLILFKTNVLRMNKLRAFYCSLTVFCALKSVFRIIVMMSRVRMIPCGPSFNVGPPVVTQLQNLFKGPVGTIYNR